MSIQQISCEKCQAKNITLQNRLFVSPRTGRETTLREMWFWLILSASLAFLLVIVFAVAAAYGAVNLYAIFWFLIVPAALLYVAWIVFIVNRTEYDYYCQNCHYAWRVPSKARVKLELEQPAPSYTGLAQAGWLISNLAVVVLGLSACSLLVLLWIPPGTTTQGFPGWSYYPLLFAMILAGLLNGWIIHRAVVEGGYKLTGNRFIDGSLLAWILGLVSGIPIMPLFLAFNPKVFDGNPRWQKYTTRIHWVARTQLLLLLVDAIVFVSLSASIRP